MSVQVCRALIFKFIWRITCQANLEGILHQGTVVGAGAGGGDVGIITTEAEEEIVEGLTLTETFQMMIMMMVLDMKVLGQGGSNESCMSHNYKANFIELMICPMSFSAPYRTSNRRPFRGRGYNSRPSNQGGVFSRLGQPSGSNGGSQGGYIGQPAMASSWSKVTVSISIIIVPFFHLPLH